MSRVMDGILRSAGSISTQAGSLETITCLSLHPRREVSDGLALSHGQRSLVPTILGFLYFIFIKKKQKKLST